MVKSEKNNVLHILASLNIGGIEVLCKNYSDNSQINNHFITVYSEGIIFNEMKCSGKAVTFLNLKNRHFLCIKDKIIKYCIKNKISTVVVHHPITVLLLLLPTLKRKLPNVKFILYAHSNAKEILRTKEKIGLLFRKYIIIRAFNTADIIIAISESVKLSLRDVFGIKNNIITLYNGIDLSKFSSRKRYSKLNRRFIFVGRLVEIKGVQEIIKCLSEISIPPDFVLTIIGDGPYRATLEKLTSSLNLSKYIIFKGQSNNVPFELLTQDVFIHYPVIEEGFGLTIVEAMSVGLLCLCRKIGGISEIITSGVNGFLVNDHTELKARINYLLNEISCQEENLISEQAIARAKVFSIQNYAKELDDLITL